MSTALDAVSATAVAKPAVPRWRKLLPLIGLLVLGWVLWRMDLPAMGRALGRVSVDTVLLASGSFCANLLLKAYRWQRLLAAQGIRIPLRVAVAAFLSGQFYGQVTLGRAGEFLRVEALLEREVSMGAALASCVFDRLLDLFVVLAAGSVLSALVLGDRRVALLALAMMVVGALAVALGLHWVGAPAEPSGPSNLPQRVLAAMEQRKGIVARLAKMIRDMATGMRPMLRPLPLLEASFWSAIAWVGYFGALWQLADGLGLGVSRILLTATAAFAALSALLPVTVSGLGARELIYISVLSTHGVPKESAVVMSLLHLFVMSVSATLLGFGGVLWRQRQRL
ncbi:MAG TPA: lysylphosphatidylglycerol synthase transmembrane domain-containing protein [Polyangiales bacterium]